MNKNLFRSTRGPLMPATDTTNHEHAPAFAFPAKHKLAQYATTGCLNGTFYASAEAQLDDVLRMCAEVEPEFIAKAAIYARERGFMKDMPALLCAVLAVRAPDLLPVVFERVVDNGRMLRNFVGAVRSGRTGRKSLGSRPKRLVRNWLERRGDRELLQDSVGADPSLADVVRMVHPKPATPQREAFYGWLIGRSREAEALPEAVAAYEAWRADPAAQPLPDVPFQMLASQQLGRDEWIAIARRAPWHMTRMNLNTFARHGVFEDRETVRLVAKRLRDAEMVRRSRVFPFQLLAAFRSAGTDVPGEVRDALQDAMELAIGNVPRIEGRVFVCADVSGSMRSPVTGYRKGASSAVRCVDVAALVAAAFVRTNKHAEVLPFEHQVVELRLNARDTVMTNAERLASVGGGGTNCSAPLALLNMRNEQGDLVVFVSDNESWVDARRGRGTQLLEEWNNFRRRNREARLVCIDVQPNGSTQAMERADILNIGGFSDAVFDVVAAFAEGKLQADHWTGVIEKVAL